MFPTIKNPGDLLSDRIGHLTDLLTIRGEQAGQRTSSKWWKLFLETLVRDKSEIVQGTTAYTNYVNGTIDFDDAIKGLTEGGHISYKAAIINLINSKVTPSDKEATINLIEGVAGIMLSVFKQKVIELGDLASSSSNKSQGWLSSKTRWVKSATEKVRSLFKLKPSNKIDPKKLVKITKDTMWGASAIANMLSVVGIFRSDSRPSLVLGPVPIRKVQSVEIGHSGEVLKYRAVGSVFLAQQVGGNYQDTITIQGKLTGPSRFANFFALWALFLYGQGNQKEIADKYKKINEQGEFRAALGNLSGTYNAKLQNPSYESHLTFPVITEYEIIPNCYIETFSFEESVEFGKDVISYYILLRTYWEPSEFNLFEPAEEDLEINSVGKIKAVGTRSKYYAMATFAANLLYRSIMGLAERTKDRNVFDFTSWKKTNGYNLDPLDLASGFSIGVLAYPVLKV